MALEQVQVEIAPGKVITIETGRLAKQAGGSALVRLGDTMVLVTACIGKEADGDFFPLTVEYREKTYAVGKFPGGFNKREARPNDKEILTSRIIDRPLRPLFPKGYRNEVQIVATVINGDGKHDADTIAVIGASFAVGMSNIPYGDQVACVRVARVDGELVIDPTYEQVIASDMEMVVAGSRTSIMMVEGGAYEISEEEMVAAITAGHEAIKKILVVQEELLAKVRKPKLVYNPPAIDTEVFSAVEAVCAERLRTIFASPLAKAEFYATIDAIKAEVKTALAERFPEKQGLVSSYFGDIEKREMREAILTRGIRIDGRDTKTVRPISIETGFLPNCHGSALFQRGETQALVVCTLGSKFDEQKVDTIQGDWYKNYFLHYNFPPYSVGEVGRLSGVGRREIGHGHLAERSLEPVIPTAETFPYTIRIVSEILESNGSSSMASVCGGSLAMMDTGVPIKTPVAGIAMGLISENNRVAVLSDITGTEDHLGDMDFKVTGTEKGVTAFQMDIKIDGITAELMLSALHQARDGRKHILGIMNEAISKPKEISKMAPCVIKKSIPMDRIKDLIGPGGRVIRGIQEATGATIDIQDDGKITVVAPKRANGNMAVKMIDELFAEVEVGTMYKGKIKTITAFGVFVEVMPGREGLVHISELDVPRGAKLEGSFSMGQELMVKCIGIDPQNRIKLSAKQTEVAAS